MHRYNWYLTPCERTVLVRLRVCTRNTIALASRVFCDILAANIGIVRKACVVPPDKVCMERSPASSARRPISFRVFPASTHVSVWRGWFLHTVLWECARLAAARGEHQRPAV
jgi:hypothetical protein